MNITDIEYSINGGSAQSSGQTEFPITINTTGSGSRSVRVRTRAGNIVSPWSNAMTGTPIVPEPPLDPPSNFRVTSSTETSISLAWNSVSNADGYEIFRDGSLITQTSGTSFIDSGLSSDTEYSYTIRSFNNSSTSSHSSPITGTTQEESVDPPDPFTDRIWGQWEFEANGNFPDLADYSSTSEWTFNVGKSASRGTSGRAGTVSRGLKYVPHVDANVNRDGEGNAWNRIVRYKQDFGGGRDDSELAFIHIIDEPHRKGALYSFLESAMAEGRKSSRNGPNVKYGYTINASHLRALPNPTINVEGTQTPNPLGTPTVDYILFQYYPFRNPNHPDWSQSETATNKSGFLSLGATRISQLRGYFPNSEVIIVAQSFYGEHDKFLKPPDEAPLWYAELAEQEDIAGTIWWTRLTKGSGDARTYGSDRGEFEDFRNNMELAYNQYIK